MKRLLIFLSLTTTLIFTSCNEESNSEIVVVSAEEMQELSELEDVQLVDVRTPEEYSEGFIAGFQNIDYLSGSFDEDIAHLDKSKPVIVYCQKGSRSSKCARKMKEAGFVKIYDLDGGIAKWKFKGFDIKSVQ